MSDSRYLQRLFQGACTRWGGGGGVDLRRGHFSVKMYAKMKELGPMAGHAPHPRSANGVNGVN